MLCSFLFQIWKYLGEERKNILRHYLIGDKIIQNCPKIDATHFKQVNTVLAEKDLFSLYMEH